MKKYSVKWSDGNGAASRGMDCDSVFYNTILANNDDEALKVAYILKACNDSTFGEEYKLQDAKDLYASEMMGYDDEKDLLENGEQNDIKEYKEVVDFDPKQAYDLLEDRNMDGIDGGEPWIIFIKNSNGKMIYDNTDCDVYDEDDVQDRIDNLPTKIKVSEEDLREYFGLEEDEDIGDLDNDYDYDDICEALTDYCEEELELDLDIYDFDDLVGKIEIKNFTYTKLKNGSYNFNVEWEADTDF